ncbi:MAG: hypothetical protein ACHP7P_10640 [Terriglobales bacterium]
MNFRLRLPALGGPVGTGGFTLYWSATEQVNPDNSITVTPSVEISGYDGSSFTADCIASTNIATNRASLMMNDNPWFGSRKFSGGRWLDFAQTGPAVQISPGQTADMSFGGAVDAACWYDSPEGAPSFDDWYSYEFQNELGSPCFIGINCPYPLPQLEYPGVDTETISVFSALSEQLVRISTTWWGPPVVQTKDVCYWGSLACSAGTPTCTTGIGVVFVPVCPAYVEANYLVINGQCFGVHPLTEASGPGPCN